MISIALKFVPEKNDAPEVIASGSGYLGDKIVEIAQKNNVPIVKDSELAIQLYKIPLDQEIPENLYKAVASIFSFIYKLEKDLIKN